MGETQRYDAIVIGSGQAGTPLSKTLAQAGRKTGKPAYVPGMRPPYCPVVEAGTTIAPGAAVARHVPAWGF